MKKIYKLLFVFVLLFSCSSNDSEDDNTNDATSIDLLTGINAKQDDISGYYLLGNPNVRMPLNIASTSIIAFPNPSTGYLSVKLMMTNDVISDVWIVPGRVDKEQFQNVDFDDILTGITYTIDEISDIATESFNDLDNNELVFNLESLETGYYRVFIKTNQNLYWDNIYLDNGNGLDITEIFDYWD
ncbi:MAG: hypothetical protein HRU50_03610 [Winogradskyella sp.]|uniref:hypothetical protein n=1 Tax=Winogradskyella sp. TaxID=1883156 RepID=UPI0025FC74F8|nr:hypothetical protein [Winogradskyella sp.]NRB59013.1 hypothetical protein [Winogradskyella sp.]